VQQWPGRTTTNVPALTDGRSSGSIWKYGAVMDDFDVPSWENTIRSRMVQPVAHGTGLFQDEVRA
jgi:hypothetical protein